MSIEASHLATRLQGLRISSNNGEVSAALAELTVGELSPGNVVVRTAYAGVNYKDALATTTQGRVIRDFPRIGGIDLSGTVVASDDPRYAPGDRVLAHSRGLGVDHDGGFADYVRMPAGYLHAVPAGLDLA